MYIIISISYIPLFIYYYFKLFTNFKFFFVDAVFSHFIVYYFYVFYIVYLRVLNTLFR